MGTSPPTHLGTETRLGTRSTWKAMENPVTRMSGSRYLAEALHAYGLSHVFMVPTVAVPALAEMDTLGITGIMTHGEKAAAYMADGYARVTRRPGVCLAQTIGSANLAAGLRDAYMAGSPVIAITGGTRPGSRYRHVYQEIEDFPLYEPLTKFNAHIDDVGRLPDLLRQAFREATSGASGPVHLEIQGLGADLLTGDLSIDNSTGPLAEPRFSRVPAFRPAPEDDLVREAIGLLSTARRPIIVAGGGLVSSGAGSELAELARRLMIPVATSLNAKGSIDETDPLAVGVVGSYSRTCAMQALSDADLVFFIGSHSGSQVTDQWRLPPLGATVIQLDIDPRELGRNYPNAVSLNGDARTTLRRMMELAEPVTDRHEWLETVAEYVRAWRAFQRPKLESDDAPIRPERLCNEITKVLPDDGILVCDTGHAGIWVGSMIDLHPGQSFLRCAGSLGWAFPAALGAKCAQPDRSVICFTGDGGFYYHLAELETAARYGINAVIVVNNNRSLSQDKKVFRNAWDGSARGDSMWVFQDINLAAIATDLGCASIRVTSPEEIGDALKVGLEMDKPVIIDVVTDIGALPDPPFGGRDFYDAS